MTDEQIEKAFKPSDDGKDLRNLAIARVRI